MRGTFGHSLQQHLMAGAAIVAVVSASPAEARTRNFDVPAQPAAQGIPAFAKQAGVQIIASGNVVRDRRTNGVRGAYTVEEGLHILLNGTGLAAGPAGQTGIITIVQSAEGNAGAAGEVASSLGEGSAAAITATNGRAERQDIVVTGSRIKGGPPTSPIIQLTQQQIRDAGQNSLAEVIRSIPQNFGGGQNPTVAIGASTSNSGNSNVTGGSAINLRGLGPDATLTLLNGRRLSYDSFGQAVDVSVIPLAALDRLEIVADGASAIYGSDAVAGVANVILKKDYDGVNTTGRLGQATDGGDFQQEYNITGGKRWNGGGFIATYDFADNSAILARQRSYTDYLRNPYDLIPSQRSHSGLISGHQDITSSLTFSVDALYTRRHTRVDLTLSPTATSPTTQDTENYVISPNLSLNLGGDWNISLGGVYGRDDSTINSFAYSPSGALLAHSSNCYCNETSSAEVVSRGTLINLPGGPVKIAIGGGYRKNSFTNRSLTSANVTSGRRHSYYAFGEVFIPIVSPAQGIIAVNSASLTVAGRYERYNDFGSIFTPKIGAIYSPVEGLDLKGSWGRSFKAPTLSQQYSASSSSLYRANTFGGTAFPATATVLLAGGGNPNLQPERAETYTGTISIHPARLRGFSAEVSYFNISYSDRVVSPIASLGTALSNPLYAKFITYSPTQIQLQQIIAAAPSGLLNFSGLTYSPGSVVAIVNNLSTNALSQKIHGIDISSDYSFSFGDGTLNLISNASILNSRQKRTTDSPFVNLAGTVFYPPKFRYRGGVTWHNKAFSASGFFNYIGGVHNNNVTPNQDGASMATIDLALRFRPTTGSGIFRGLEISASMQNIMNEKPPHLAPANAVYVPYDSTNYSPLGRFVSISISKNW